jgi:hypothetical protein
MDACCKNCATVLHEPGRVCTSCGKSTARSVATARRAGQVLFAVASVALFIALFLPWWSVRVFRGFTYLSVSTGFSGWGWLSVAACLATLVVTARIFVLPQMGRVLPVGKRLDSRMTACVSVAAGVTELLGNVLFIAAAPKTNLISGGLGLIVKGRGVGLTMAMVAGAVIIVSGLLLLISPKYRTAPVSSGQDAPSPLVG